MKRLVDSDPAKVFSRSSELSFWIVKAVVAVLVPSTTRPSEPVVEVVDTVAVPSCAMLTPLRTSIDVVAGTITSEALSFTVPPAPAPPVPPTPPVPPIPPAPPLPPVPPAPPVRSPATPVHFAPDEPPLIVSAAFAASLVRSMALPPSPDAPAAPVASN